MGRGRSGARVLSRIVVLAALALPCFALAPPAAANPLEDILNAFGGLIANPSVLAGRPLFGNGADGSSGAPGQVTSTLSNGAALQGGGGGNGGDSGFVQGAGGSGGNGGSGALVTGSGASDNSGSLTGWAGGNGGKAG